MAEKFTPMHYIVVILVAGMVAAVAAVSWGPQDPATIAVSGYAEMLSDPNEAHVYLGVASQAATASDAQSVTSTTIGTVIAAIRQAGVAEEDIETYYLRISPRYDWESGKQEIVGYEATHMLKARVTDMENVGEVVNAAVTAGSNKIERVDYSVDEETEASLKRQLLAEAALDARTKAQGLADSLGVRILRVRSASESVSYSPYRVPMAEAATAGAYEMPPGQVELSGTASVVYEIA